MSYFLNQIKKRKELTTLIITFSTFIIIGVLLHKDYGISVDEWDLRRLGFVYLKYIFEIFNINNLLELDKIMNIPKVSDYGGNTHGVIFVLPMAFIEYFFNITDIQKNYFLRHIINHFIFLISNFYFFLLVKERFNNWLYGFFASIFLFLSPRIYAESFYNHKDILFMSFFIISLYYGIKFLKNPSIRNSLLFSLSTALSTDIRIMGIILVPIIFFFIFLNKHNYVKKYLTRGTIIYFITLPIFIYIFWPYLWTDPINHFVEIFKNLSSYNWEGYNLYFGEYILGSNLPWHYVLVWIGITTPLLYIFLFFVGFTNTTLILKNRIFLVNEKINEGNIWKGDDELHDLIYYLLFLIPIILVISLNSTLYDGWRHLYFIYPLFLIFTIKGLYFFYISFFKKKHFIFYSTLFVFILHIIFVMITTHPYQNVYFNFFAGKNIVYNFDVDYWGLSNKQSFEYILKNDKRNEIKLGSAGPISLKNSMDILTYNDANRFDIVDNSEADYIINNYRNWFGYVKEEYKIPDNFSIFKEIIIHGNKIVTIYKRI